MIVGGRLVADRSPQRELAARLADRGVMRVRLAARRSPGCSSAFASARRGAGWAGDELVVPGSAAMRPLILDLIRAAGRRSAASRRKRAGSTTFYRELIGGPS